MERLSLLAISGQENPEKNQSADRKILYPIPLKELVNLNP
jgi:hypothetical protein